MDRRETDATGPALHEYGLPGLQAAKLEQAVVRGAERNRNAGREADVHALRHPPRGLGGHRPQRSVRSIRAGCRDALADPQIGHLRAHLDDRARRLIADDMGPAGEGCADAVQQVAAFDADRLNAEHDALGMTCRVRHLFVFEDFRTAVFVIDRCFHWLPLP